MPALQRPLPLLVQEAIEGVRLVIETLSVLQSLHYLPFRASSIFLAPFLRLRDIILFGCAFRTQTVCFHASVGVAGCHCAVTNFHFDFTKLGALLVTAGHAPAGSTALQKSLNEVKVRLLVRGASGTCVESSKY